MDKVKVFISYASEGYEIAKKLWLIQLLNDRTPYNELMERADNFLENLKKKR